MSFVKLPNDFFDTFTVFARPKRLFLSSSQSGIEGSVKVFKRASSIEKNSFSSFSETKFEESSPEFFLREVLKKSSQSFDVSNEVSSYLQSVNESAVDPKYDKSVEVIRFEPSFKFTSDSLRKNVIRNTILPHYKIAYPNIGWGFTNYLSLHFPDGVGPTSASIIYPNPVESGWPAYSPKKDFTVEFYVKPSYTGIEYRAGTVMHMSSCLAISIVSGSKKNYLSEADSFRVLLQLSHSADVNPSDIDVSSIPSQVQPLNFAYVSEDFKILRNHWHHVAISWSHLHNDSTGSFYVDGERAGSFFCDKNLIPFSASNDDRSIISIGNYFEGENKIIEGTHGFFNLDAVQDEGVTDAFNANLSDPLEPASYSFLNPFRGELHDIKIWDYRRTTDQISERMKDGNAIEEGLLFYVPPMFRKETLQRKVLQTPFHSFVTTTDDPFNVALSFGVGGHHINLENHVREFVRGFFPRLLHLTSSEIEYQSQDFKEANEYLYATGSTVRRNLTILPCDNGKFRPDFNILYSGSDSDFSAGGVMEKFVTDYGTQNLSFVNLSNLVATSSLFPGLVQENDILQDIMGSSPENPGVAPGSVLTIFQRTRDESSNAVTFFDSSNLFYGGMIDKGSLNITDRSVTGSNGNVSISLRDNENGGLYRADSLSAHATWSNVGFALYPEGISCITSPYLGELFGKDSFSIEMNGFQPVHVLEIQSIAPSWQINSSSSPNYKEIYLTDYVNDKTPGFVRISRVNYHDENLNIVARADLVQPINKRPGDKIMFRTKLDF